MKVVDYSILAKPTNGELVKTVSDQMKIGWQPLGGVAVSDHYLFQAMVKYGCEHEFIPVPENDLDSRYYHPGERPMKAQCRICKCSPDVIDNNRNND